jgi:hypothetical protein
VFVIVGTTTNSADGAAPTLPELLHIMGTFRPAEPGSQFRENGPVR